ncbi:DUF4150 domain-containing protein [Aliivibrio sp. S4TY2]|uniref:DUF4150 domain-containing protein n=1 Tax=Aliivibrio finisterrensis TaxID=511998 RepID=A0A4Q5KMS7_9GAMM|nr:MULTISPECIES: PAAR-like domain-containing protein [Aliivibrio]MDD9156313.1 DUF4150 domain-containing protein [Aliivibrio sp. S4TY2]MDD9160660.1 DUF4150 domain-containing protein [Aliivibrio sp. S4TY1]MDD9164020.1 DUF4150 domain-containing protein [Aliivibrio sp. S4MY2]MDD9168005.1 DUF4150 domain-containing protein [Aliivibrio sp. S4MY4]MDD9177148.1 DUF4150 domain-containing protein [Aliivibrio sp. A6]
MAVTISANGLSIVHKNSDGKANATLPDVCLTTVGNAVVPIPYGNSAKSADLANGSKTVTADGGNSIAIKGCSFSKSTGDSGGDKKGIASGTIEGEAKFITSSPTVRIEGKGVCRLSDQMTMNKANTMCLGGIDQDSVNVSTKEEGDYTIDIHCSYPRDGKPFSNAPFKLISNDGVIIHEGKLDAKGKCTVSSLANDYCHVHFDESEADYALVNRRKKNNRYNSALDDAVFFDKLVNHERAFWLLSTNTSRNNIWGIMGSKLLSDKYFIQILELEIQSHFELAINAKESQIMAQLFINALSPEAGSEQRVIDNLLIAASPPTYQLGAIIALFIQYPEKQSYHNLLARLRDLGRGNPKAFIDNFDWVSSKQQIATALDSLLSKLINRIEFLKTQADLKRYAPLVYIFNSHISQLKTFKRTLTDDITTCFKHTKDKINQISTDSDDVFAVKTDKVGHSIEANAFVHVVHALNETPEPLILQLNYDDLEKTPASNIPFKVIFSNEQVFEGVLNPNGYAQVWGGPKLTAHIEFGDKDKAQEAKDKLPDSYKALDVALDKIAKETAVTLLDNANEKPASALIVAQFKVLVDEHLAELNIQKENFNNLSFLEQSWQQSQHAFSGIKTGITEYVPDLGEFGELMTLANIDITSLVNAIAFGEVDELEKSFKDWKQRNQEQLSEASESMEMLILIVSDPEARQILASLPKKILEAMPADKVTEVLASQVSQAGVDSVVITGSTAAGAFAGGVGAPIMAAITVAATTGRKTGKLLEETINIISDIGKLNKDKFNTHDKVQHQEKSETKLPKTCPICNDVSCKNKTKPTLGKGENTRKNSALYAGIRKKVSGYPKTHIWYTGDRSLEVHHVIPCESVEDKIWRKMFNQFSYNINGPHNSVVLPAQAILACELNVQRHKGSHDQGMALNIDERVLSALNKHEKEKNNEKILVFQDTLFAKNNGNDFRYPKAATKLIKKVKDSVEKGNLCKYADNSKKMKSEFEKQMTEHSKKILGYIDSFEWTIAWDSRDYKPSSKLGCCGNEGIEAKRENNNRALECPDERNHELGKGKFNSKLELGK